jgi:hypothetical protein
LSDSHDSDNGNETGGYDGFGSGFGPGFESGPGSDASEGLRLPPWERRERFGFLNALYLTVKDVLVAPGHFFHQMPSRVGLLQPLLFAVVIGAIATFFGWMWSLAGSSLQLMVAEDMGEVGEVLQGPWWSFVLFLFSPVIVAVGILVKAALIHLLLMLLGGNKLGFEATFRVAAYAEATSILGLLPFCGSVLGTVWGLVVVIVGLYSIHETDPWRAIVAVLLPMMLCFSAIGTGVVALIASFA